jgi:DNA-binding TFAR19-related protein (PDSD5 family)
MGAGIGQIPLLREFGQRLSGIRLGRRRDGAESVKSKIGYLASYARIAIHIGKFSLSVPKIGAPHAQ